MYVHANRIKKTGTEIEKKMNQLVESFLGWLLLDLHHSLTHASITATVHSSCSLFLHSPLLQSSYEQTRRSNAPLLHNF